MQNNKITTKADLCIAGNFYKSIHGDGAIYLEIIDNGIDTGTFIPVSHLNPADLRKLADYLERGKND